MFLSVFKNESLIQLGVDYSCDFICVTETGRRGMIDAFTEREIRIAGYDIQWSNNIKRGRGGNATSIWYKLKWRKYMVQSFDMYDGRLSASVFRLCNNPDPDL